MKGNFYQSKDKSPRLLVETTPARINEAIQYAASLDVLALPFVKANQKKSMPKKSGIYFLISRRDIYYIGRSEDLNSRFCRGHNRWKEFSELPDPLIYWALMDNHETFEREAQLIRKHQPILNRQFNIERVIGFDQEVCDADQILGAPNLSESENNEKIGYEILSFRLKLLSDGTSSLSELAVNEWEYVESKECGKDDNEMCLCRNEIKSLHFVQNIRNDNRIFVGSTCIKTFLGERGGKYITISERLKKISKDEPKILGLTKDQIHFLRDEGRITGFLEQETVSAYLTLTKTKRPKISTPEDIEKYILLQYSIFREFKIRISPEVDQLHFYPEQSIEQYSREEIELIFRSMHEIIWVPKAFSLQVFRGVNYTFLYLNTENAEAFFVSETGEKILLEKWKNYSSLRRIISSLKISRNFPDSPKARINKAHLKKSIMFNGNYYYDCDKSLAELIKLALKPDLELSIFFEENKEKIAQIKAAKGQEDYFNIVLKRKKFAVEKGHCIHLKSLIDHSWWTELKEAQEEDNRAKLELMFEQRSKPKIKPAHPKSWVWD